MRRGKIGARRGGDVLTPIRDKQRTGACADGIYMAVHYQRGQRLVEWRVQSFYLANGCPLNKWSTHAGTLPALCRTYLAVEVKHLIEVLVLHALPPPVEHLIERRVAVGSQRIFVTTGTGSVCDNSRRGEGGKEGRRGEEGRRRTERGLGGGLRRERTRCALTST